MMLMNVSVTIDCVFFFCSECHFEAPTSSSSVKYSMDYGDCDSSLVPSSLACYDDFTLMFTGEDGNCVVDSEGGDDDISKEDEEEEQEARMDLTDDLLHMVSHSKRIIFVTIVRLLN